MMNTPERRPIHLLVRAAEQFHPPARFGRFREDEPLLAALVVVNDGIVLRVEELLAPRQEVVPDRAGAAADVGVTALFFGVVEEGAVLAGVEVVEQATEKALVEFEASWILVEELVSGV